MSVISYLNDFFALIFPNLCASCNQSLVNGEKYFCLQCIYELPRTNYHLDRENNVAKQFWGRVNILSAAAFLYFNKGSKVQDLMHQLKYQNRPELAEELGKMYAKDLALTDIYKNVEAIIAVPLHKKRLKKRGYNQSEYFSKGLADGMNLNVDHNILLRSKITQTQVNKSRFNRYENMGNTFVIKDEYMPYNEVILVDDTITTGATLEACAIALQNAGCKQIHILGIAYTE